MSDVTENRGVCSCKLRWIENFLEFRGNIGHQASTHAKVVIEVEHEYSDVPGPDRRWKQMSFFPCAAASEHELRSNTRACREEFASDFNAIPQTFVAVFHSEALATLAIPSALC